MAPQEAFAFTITTPPNSLTLSSGLVGWWTFDGKDTSWTSATAATTLDKSGNNNTGTLTNMNQSTSPVAGKIGQALKFSGSSSQYVIIGGQAGMGTVNQPYTLSAWIKPAVSNISGDVIHISSVSDGSGWCLPMLNTSSGKAQGISWTGTQSTVTGNTTLLTGKWYYLTTTWNPSSGLSIYVNGASDATPTSQATFSASGSVDYATIGSVNSNGASCSGSSGYGFSGSIDDIRIYNRALSAGEIQQLYNIGSASHIDVPPALGQTTNCSSGLSCGLVGWWTFDGKNTYWTSSTAATTDDLSGNGNTGTLTNMNQSTSPVPGKIGQALSFNGSNQYVVSQNYSFLSSTYSATTMTAWVYRTSSYDGSIINYGEYSDTAYGSGLAVSGGQVAWMSGYGPSTNVIKSGLTVPLNKWSLIGFAKTGSAITFFLNTSSAGGTDTFANLSIVSYQPFTIAVASWNGARLGYFNGIIDDARVYNRTLSAGEIQQLYNIGSASHINAPPVLGQTTSCTSGLSCGLVGWWTFDGKDTNWTSATAATTLDKSGNGNTGTLTNMNQSTSPVPGKIGQALQFNGSNQYISIGSANIPSCEQTVSVSAWVKLTSLPASDGWVASRYTLYGSNYNLFYLYLTGTNHNQPAYNAMVSASGGSHYQAISSTPLLLNQWYHIVGTSDGLSSVNLYVNGVATSGSFVDFNGYCGTYYSPSIGSSFTSSAGNYFTGSIDDVRIYNRALSASEVQQLYNLGR
ncbi:MAG: LamG domain-containing protein [Patescibacteria group bacterium]|nr:LamG domain-containing protein [Patescibacteria group bacterium]